MNITLETERLIIRPMKIDDAETVFKNWTGDPDVARYCTWNVHNSVEDTIGFIEYTINANKAANHLENGIFLKDGDRLIGSCALKWLEDENGYEIGYCMMKAMWNKGIMTEAAKCLSDFTKYVLKADRLIGRHHIENPASGKVMQKIGMTYVGKDSYTDNNGKKYVCSKYVLEYNKD